MFDWVDSISYLIPDHITIYGEVYDGLELKEKHVFKGRPLVELLKKKQQDTISSIVEGSGTMNLIETFHEREIPRKLDLQFAFSYSNVEEPYVDSYCNFVNTIDGGIHLDSVKEAIARYLTNVVKKSLTEREKARLDILWVDVMSGLNLVVNLNTDMQVQFVGQTKNKVSAETLKDPIKSIITKYITEYFEDHNDVLTSLIKIVKLNAKARLEATKAKNATVKESTNNLEDHILDNYSPANNRGKQYREIYIVEGKSAKGSAVLGRDPDTQAVFAMRGVTANAYKKDLAGILENQEWRTLVRILGCNIGAAFDRSKLKFQKIIILTDADIDGDGITSLVCAFFVRNYPELVEEGIIYKAISPLYLVDNKKHPYVNNKTEYVELFRDNITKIYKIAPLTTDGEINYMSKTEVTEFLVDTSTYLDDLEKLSKHFRVNKFLIERLAAFIKLMIPNIEDDYFQVDNLYSNSKCMLTLKESIQKHFPEIRITEHKHHLSIRGVIDGKFQSLRFNERFAKKCKSLYPTFDEYGITLVVKDKSDEQKTMTIGQFLDETKRYVPDIINRFKGLGESDPEELWETTLNPDTRTLIQLTSDDISVDDSKFSILHGDSARDKKLRKEMMKGYQISREELDN